MTDETAGTDEPQPANPPTPDEAADLELKDAMTSVKALGEDRHG